MALWSNSEANTSAPKFAVAGGLGVSANGQTLYANTTIDAYVQNLAIGVEGVTAAEEASDTLGTQHAGWNLVKRGTGPVVSITANTGAYSPDGNVYLTFSNGGTNTTTANAQIVTDGSKQILSITVNDGGEYSATPTIGAVANANVAFTITMGGRANRVQTETLVAMGSIS
jgi:hypothetical protein